MEKAGEKTEQIWNYFKIGFRRSKIDFLVRNEGSFLGVVWYLLEPLVLFLLILMIRDQMSFFGHSNYPVYLFVGLIVFNFFRRATSLSISAINSNLSLLKNAKFPPEPLVISKVFDTAFSHILEFLILMILMIFFHISLWHLVLYIVFFCIFFAFTLGVSLMISALGVFVKDLNNVWMVLTQILWFATPIFYVAKPGGPIATLVSSNPLFHFVEGQRGAILYGRLVSWTNFWGMLIAAVLALWIGILIFQKLKSKFPEIA